MSLVRVRRIVAASIAAVGLALVPALTASAHVTVSSPDATPGGFGKLVFRVPNESETASTTALSVDLPKDTPFAFVSVRPVAGWTVETTTEPLAEPVELEGGFTVTEAVANVTWTADAEENGIGPGEFTEFEVSAGPFPADVDQLMFPATQTYSDGEVAEWIEPVEEGQPEPERPAPVLELSGSSAPAESDGGGSSDTLAIVLGAVGIVLGAIALVVALTGRRRGPANASVT